jgi:hypothetical protein
MLDRFRAFWQRQGRLSKIALVAVVVVFALVAIGELAGGSDDNGAEVSATETETTTSAKLADDPIACLEAAGLSNVEERDSDFWRGYNDSPFYQISAALLPTEAEAQQAVADAVDVYAEQAGSYAVTGPVRASVEGAGLTGDEGQVASQLVQAVASCLGG